MKRPNCANSSLLTLIMCIQSSNDNDNPLHHATCKSGEISIVIVELVWLLKKINCNFKLHQLCQSCTKRTERQSCVCWTSANINHVSEMKNDYSARWADICWVIGASCIKYMCTGLFENWNPTKNTNWSVIKTNETWRSLGSQPWDRRMFLSRSFTGILTRTPR